MRFNALVAASGLEVKEMKYLKFAGALAALAMAAGATAASATTYHLNIDGSSTGLGGDGDYGTVDVTSTGTGDLLFVFHLDTGINFINTGGHTSFAFSLDGDSGQTITFSGVTSGWTFSGPGSFVDPAIAPPSGPTFEYGGECDTCGHDLTFTVVGSGSTQLVLSGITYNGQTVLGAADLVNTANGNTGAVGFGGGTPGVPEPATWAMLIVGMGMVGAGMRMRRRSALTPA
ncbi:MAG TPA: PEPxxWA-CTERM sorting domain-containing protein [Caulobacteraceae bacterium]|nr:PEPxxWA-CTERM sorting domain-containing protein [Caulobacteraceae bacterium]